MTMIKLGNYTRDHERLKERPWVATLKLTVDEPRVCLCECHVLCVLVCTGVGYTSVTLHTHTHSEWHTSLFAMLVMFFLFLAQIEFPVPDSAARKALGYTTPCDKERFLWPGCICITDLGTLPWSGTGEVLILVGTHKEWEARGCLLNLWRRWNCQVIVMLCYWFERIQKQVLAED